MHKKTRTLVVEGGGLRGAFSAGVMAEFADSGAPHFDDIIAVSSAAPTAAYLITKQITEGMEIWREHTHGDHLISFSNIFKGTPLLDVDRLVDKMEGFIRLNTKAIDSALTRLWIGVTNCHTGAPEYIRATSSNIFRLLRATMALPVAYGRVVDVDGIPYIDGGVTEAVPVHHGLSFGRDQTLVILTQPQGYRRKPDRTLSWLMGMMYPKFPGISQALQERGIKLNATLETLDRLEQENRVSILRPKENLAAKRLSRKREDILASIETGRLAARNWLQQTRA